MCDAGYLTISPSFSPDGNTVVLLSNKGSDFSGTALYTMNSDGKNLTRIEGAVSSRGVFSPDGKKLLYAKHRSVDKYGSMLRDLYTYDLGTSGGELDARELQMQDVGHGRDDLGLADAGDALQ